MGSRLWKGGINTNGAEYTGARSRSIFLKLLNKSFRYFVGQGNRNFFCSPITESTTGENSWKPGILQQTESFKWQHSKGNQLLGWQQEEEMLELVMHSRPLLGWSIIVSGTEEGIGSKWLYPGLKSFAANAILVKTPLQFLFQGLSFCGTSRKILYHSRQFVNFFHKNWNALLGISWTDNCSQVFRFEILNWASTPFQKNILHTHPPRACIFLWSRCFSWLCHLLQMSSVQF